MPQLSEKVLDLVRKARIVSFATWHDQYSDEVIQRFQTADDERRYLTDDDIQVLRTASGDDAGALIDVAQLLGDRASDIVDEGRAVVLSTFPTITQPGGGLYPSARAEACWRDFWQFLRCITYGIAGQRVDYTSAEGFHYMNLLYQELQVPLDAMVMGLEGVKAASLSRVDEALRPQLGSYFDQLIDQLRQFKAAYLT